MVGLAAPPADDKDARQARRRATARGSRMGGGGGGGATSLSRQRATAAPGGNAALVVAAASHSAGRIKGRVCKVGPGRTRCRGVGETKGRREERQTQGRGEEQQKGNERRQPRPRRAKMRSPSRRVAVRGGHCGPRSVKHTDHAPLLAPAPVLDGPVAASTPGERGVPEGWPRRARQPVCPRLGARGRGGPAATAPRAPHPRALCSTRAAARSAAGGAAREKKPS